MGLSDERKLVSPGNPIVGGPLTRQALVFSAAKALMSLPDDELVGMASSSTAKFVQCVRPIYKGAGFNFDDNDLRNIHGFVQRFAKVKVDAMLMKSPHSKPKIHLGYTGETVEQTAAPTLKLVSVKNED